MEYFLQSPEWAEFQSALGHKVHRESGPGWSFLAIEETNPAGKVLYSPYGPLASSPGALDSALDALAELGRARGALFARIEPVAAGLNLDTAADELRRRGLYRAPSNPQPEHTWVVDLEGDFEDVLAAMKPVNRNLYRNIHKKGVTFRRSKDPADIRYLLDFLHMTARRNGFKPQSDEYLTCLAATLMPTGVAALFLAELHGEPIAAALAYDSGDTRTYAHAALDDAHRKLSAGIPLLVTLIADAQARGLKHVDLWGIAPKGHPNHKWAGFTAFKKSFGGREVAYPGAWDLPLRKFRYQGYQQARKLRDKLRSFSQGSA